MKQAKRLCTGRVGRNSLLVDILKIFRSPVGQPGRWKFQPDSSEPLVAACWKYSVFRRWHGRQALLIAPQHLIQASRTRSIGAREIHSRRDLCTRRITLVGFVNQTVLQIAIVSLIGCLMSGPTK